MEPKRIGRWTKKLNDEHKTFAMTQLACGITSVEVVKQIKEKYGIEISDVRIRNIRDSKGWFPIFNAAKQKYLSEQVDLKSIPIAAKTARLHEAHTVATKLYKLINKIDTAIDSLTEDGIPEYSAKYVLTLAKTLRETAKIYKDFLHYAKEETTNANTGRSNTGSFLQSITINSEEKPTIVEGTVIDGEVVENNVNKSVD